MYQRTHIRRSRYIIMLLLVLLIFISSLFVQMLNERSKLNFLTSSYRDDQILIQNLATQRVYLQHLVDNPQGACSVIKNSYLLSIENLYLLTNRMNSFLADNKFVDDDFTQLKQLQANTQIEFWILAQEIKNRCDWNILPIIYFFGEEGICQDCLDQAVILNNIRLNSDERLFVFSIDARLGGPVHILTQQYNITPLQTYMLIHNNVYTYQTLNELHQTICSYEANFSYC